MNRFAFALAAALSTWCASARADHDDVALEVHACDTLEGEDVRRLVTLEVAPDRRLAPPGQTATLRATVTCYADRAHIEVTPPQGSSLELDIDFERVPTTARARLLALAVAELIATSELEKVQETVSPERPSEPQLSPPPQRSNLSWWLGPGVSLLTVPSVVLAGADVGLWVELGPLLVFADVQGRWGRKRTEGAAIDVQSTSVLLGLSPRLGSGDVDVTVGPALRLGLARLEGHPEEPDVQGRAVSGPWLGPAAAATVSYRLSGWWALRGGIELGYVTRAVRGLDREARPLLSFEGPWTSATVGFGGVH